MILEEAQERISALSDVPIDLVYSKDLSRSALALSLEFGWKYLYDAFYLAVGELFDCDVWTADSLFYRDARITHPRVRLLADYASS